MMRGEARMAGGVTAIYAVASRAKTVWSSDELIRCKLNFIEGVNALVGDFFL